VLRPRKPRAINGASAMGHPNDLQSIALPRSGACPSRRTRDRRGEAAILLHDGIDPAFSGAAAGSPNVKALVYVAALAPEVNEPIAAFLERYPSDLGTALLPPDAGGFLSTWYLVTMQDRAINPDLERFYAKRMGAKTTEIRSSHVPFLSQPRRVAKIIAEAANAAP
jgi:hypothetical protein